MRYVHNRYSLVKCSFVNGILYKTFLSCDLLYAKQRPNINISSQVITDVFCDETAEKNLNNADVKLQILEKVYCDIHAGK